jgi:hypothetical protein
MGGESPRCNPLYVWIGESQNFFNDFKVLETTAVFLTLMDSFRQIREFFLLKNLLSYVNRILFDPSTAPTPCSVEHGRKLPQGQP